MAAPEREPSAPTVGASAPEDAKASDRRHPARGNGFHLGVAAVFASGVLCLGAAAVMLQLTWVYGTGGRGFGISPVVPLLALLHLLLGTLLIAAASACWAMRRPPTLAVGLLAGCGAIVMLATGTSPIGRASLLVPIALLPAVVLAPLGAWRVTRGARGARIGRPGRRRRRAR